MIRVKNRPVFMRPTDSAPPSPTLDLGHGACGPDGGFMVGKTPRFACAAEGQDLP